LGSAGLTIENGRITGIDPLGGSSKGPFVIPSFIDAHCHFSWTGLQAISLDLSGVSSSDGMLEALAAESAALPAGLILRAEKMEEISWEVPIFPSLSSLDAVTGDRPTFIRRVCGHMILVNSAMMNLLPAESPGLDRSSGLIREGIALKIDRLFPPDPETLRRAFISAEKTALSAGVTAVGTFEPLFTLAALGEIPLRIGLAAGVIADDPAELEEVLSSDRTPIPRLLGLKTFLDGSIGAGTAALSGTYTDGSSAMPVMSDEELTHTIRTASDLGMATLVHAIGGRALDMLDRVCRTLRETSPAALSPGIRIEHAEELLGDWPGSWDATVHSFCMQPNFVNRWQMEDGLYQQMMGSKASRSLNPFASVLAGEFRLGFGSDGMPFGPLHGLAGATSHPDPVQRLDIGTALHAYTLGAADICGFMELATPLRNGRTADLAFLSESPFEIGSWEETELLATMVAGVTVFKDQEVLDVRSGSGN